MTLVYNLRASSNGLTGRLMMSGNYAVQGYLPADTYTPYMANVTFYY